MDCLLTSLPLKNKLPRNPDLCVHVHKNALIESMPGSVFHTGHYDKGNVCAY